MTPQVAIIMGSKSDLPIMQKAADMLKELNLSYSVHIYSAHRTHQELAEFIDKVNTASDYDVIIAGAGMSAALAGSIAAQTLKPVIGVPLSGGKFKGVESVLSTLEMPPGIPVLTVGVDAAKNAALAAASIIALYDSDVAEALAKFRKEQKEAVIKANEELENMDLD